MTVDLVEDGYVWCNVTFDLSQFIRVKEKFTFNSKNYFLGLALIFKTNLRCNNIRGKLCCITLYRIKRLWEHQERKVFKFNPKFANLLGTKRCFNSFTELFSGQYSPFFYNISQQMLVCKLVRIFLSYRTKKKIDKTSFWYFKFCFGKFNVSVRNKEGVWGESFDIN